MAELPEVADEIPSEFAPIEDFDASSADLDAGLGDAIDAGMAQEFAALEAQANADEQSARSSLNETRDLLTRQQADAAAISKTLNAAGDELSRKAKAGAARAQALAAANAKADGRERAMGKVLAARRALEKRKAAQAADPENVPVCESLIVSLSDR